MYFCFKNIDTGNYNMMQQGGMQYPPVPQQQCPMMPGHPMMQQQQQPGAMMMMPGQQSGFVGPPSMYMPPGSIHQVRVMSLLEVLWLWNKANMK